MKNISVTLIIFCIMLTILPIPTHASEINAITFAPEYEDRQEPLFDSTMETEWDVRGYIGNGVVFSDKKTFVVKGVKMNYTTYDCDPYISNGIFMLPLDLLLSALDKNGTVSGGVISVENTTLLVNSDKMNTLNGEIQLSAMVCVIRDKIYVPVKEFCEKGLAMFTYTDERGYIMIDDSPIEYTNSSSIFTINEPADAIYRYLEFERPTGKQLLADKIKHSGNGHPRILSDRANLDETKMYIDSDGCFDRMLEMLSVKADAILPLACVSKTFVGSNILNSAKAFAGRVETLSTMYLLTGESKYAKKCFEEMENVCNWQEETFSTGDWNQYGHYLDVSEITCAMAIGYDSIYDYLNVSQRELIARKTYENSLLRAVEVYGGNYDGAAWCMSASNWSFVCAGSIIAACLSFSGDGYTEYESTYEFLLGEAIHSIEYPIMGFYADGVWVEGGDYWNYATLYMCKGAMAPLFFSCGKVYGLLDAEGVDETLKSILTLQSGSGGGFNYSDGSTDMQAGAQGYLIARLLQDDVMMKQWYESRRRIMTVTSVDWASGLEILWYRPVTVTQSEEIVYDKYFKGSGVGVMRERVDTTGAFVGIKAGNSSTLSHSHLDLGSFIFGDDGQRFAIDLGKDDYYIQGGYWGYSGYELYRKRPEGHNCVVINPRADDVGLKNYGGQYADAYASMEEIKSGEADAYTVVDLSDAYKFDTSSYKRGFRLSDMRKSLTVQDEITLLEDNSMIYWFMHTKAEIIIDADGKGATLIQDGNKLRVKAACNADSWHFEKREAQPFDTSPIRVGQLQGNYSNDGISKLTLAASGSGEIVISVKLMCIEDFELNGFTAIQDWSTDSESEKDIVLDGVSEETVFDIDGDIAVPAYIPESFNSACLYVDGVKKVEIGSGNAGNKTFVLPAGSIKSGMREIEVEANYINGTTKKSKGIYLPFAEYGDSFSENKTNIDFEGCDSTLTAPSDIVTAAGGWWQFHDNSAACSITEGNNGGKAVKTVIQKPVSASKPYIRVIHGKSSGAGAQSTIKKGVTELCFDLLSSSERGEVRLGARTSSGGTLFAFYPFTPEGYIAESDMRYEKNKWFSFKILIDLDGKCYAAYCDKKLIGTGSFVHDNFQFADITYASCQNGEIYFATDNIKVCCKNLKPDMLYASNFLTSENAKISACCDFYATGEQDIWILFCEYSEDGKKIIKSEMKNEKTVSGRKNVFFSKTYTPEHQYKLITIKPDNLAPICNYALIE